MSDYRLISADSHFVEPPRVWAERIDRRFRDRAPHAEKLEAKPGWHYYEVFQTVMEKQGMTPKAPDSTQRG